MASKKTPWPTVATILGMLVVPAFSQDELPQSPGNNSQLSDAIAEWMKKAEQGDASAQSYVGLSYELGQGVPYDYVLAVRWYLAAAEQGHATAQNNLGGLYESGRGVLYDYVEAARWYLAAAEQGHPLAQFNLGVMYDYGRGVPQDYIQAHMWCNLAASDLTGERREQATKNRDLIAEKMTSEQIAEAQRLAREWKPKSSGSQ
jgi:hypothetical protein